MLDVDDGNVSGNEGDGEEYRAPKPKPPATTTAKSKGKGRQRTAKPKVAPAPKKPRTTKASGPKKATTRAPRKAKNGIVPVDATKPPRERKIADDNDLFSASDRSLKFTRRVYPSSRCNYEPWGCPSSDR